MVDPKRVSVIQCSVTEKKEGDKERGKGRNGGKAEEGRSKNIVPCSH